MTTGGRIRYGRELRLAVWGCLALLVAARLTVGFLPLEPAARVLAADGLAYLLPLALAASAAAAATRVTRGVERRFWVLVGVGCASALVSESYWTWYIVNVDAHGPSLRHPTQLIALVGAACFALTVGSMTAAAGRSIAYRVRFYLDAIAVMAVIYPVVYLQWTLPAYAGFDDQVFYAARTALWPVFGSVMLLAILALAGGLKAGRWQIWERLAVVAIALFSVGLILNAIWYPAALKAGTTESGWYGMLLGAGLYLFVVAATYRLTAEPGELPAEPTLLVAPATQGLEWNYPIVLTAALPLLIWAADELAVPGTEEPIISAAIVLALALAARGWLLAVETADHRIAAITDPATGLYSARYLDERLLQLAADSGPEAAGPHSFALLVLRVDDFARIDALSGRVTGDRLLAATAQAIRSVPASGAEGFRSRSDEFAVVLPSMSPESAESLAGALLEAVERADLPKAVPASQSIGIAHFPADADNPGDLLTRARMACDVVARARSLRVLSYSASLSDPRADASPVLAPVRRLSTAVRALADAADERDTLTAGHSQRVGALAERLALELGLPAEQADSVRLAGSVHDVGKLGVRASALGRPEPLTGPEQEEFRRHPVLGARILKALGLGEVSSAVLHHHERWDGSGYPAGLSEQLIPQEARVLAICDVYDAMVSGRPGWSTLEPEDARRNLSALGGTHFDPHMVEVFVTRVAPASPQPAVVEAPPS